MQLYSYSSYSILSSVGAWAQVWNTSHWKGDQQKWDQRIALIIVISVKDKDDLSYADYRFTFLSEQALKSFSTLSVVWN